MPGVIAEAFVEIKPILTNFTSKLKGSVDETVRVADTKLGQVPKHAAEAVGAATHESEGFLSRMKGQITELAAFALPALGAVEVYKFGKEAVAAARAEEKQLARTKNVLQTTGGAAHVTADEVERLAQKQSLATGITQTQIRSNENMLLTFTNVRNEVGKGNDIFTRANSTVLDLSKSMGIGMAGATKIVGKALNDPIKGMAGLSRVGIQFSDVQKKNIANWVAQGKTAKAQAFILDQLDVKFKGSAAAQATAGEKMKAAWEVVSVQLGDKLLPVIDKVENFITTHLLPAVSALLGEGKKSGQSLAPFITAVKSFVGPALQAFQALSPLHTLFTVFKQVIPVLLPFITQLATTIGSALGKTMQQLAPIIALIVTELGQLVKIFINALRPILPVIVQAVQKLFAALGPLVVVIFKLASQILRALMPVLRFLLPIILRVASVILNVLVSALSKIISVVTTVITWFLHLGDHAKQLWHDIDTAFHAILAWFSQLASKIVSIFKNAISWLVRAGRDILSGLWNGIKNVWQNVISWIGHINGWVLNKFASAARWLWNAGKDILSGLWNGIKNVWNSVVNWFKDLPGRVLNFFKNAATWLYNAGKNVILGILHGLEHAVGAVIDWFKSIPSKILGWLGIHSPPDWAVNAGGWIIKGLVKGLGKFGGLLKTAVIHIAESALHLITGNVHKPTDLGGALKQNLENYAHQIMQGTYGWFGNSDYYSLIDLWNGESGWDPTISSGGGHGYEGPHVAYGIPQALPGTKMASAGADWQTNPYTQIDWGLQYIHDRYGSPSRAYAEWQSRNPHWYARGAWEVPNDNHLALLHRKEMVVPADQAEKFRQQASSPLDAQVLARAVAQAIDGATLYLDPDGVARLVTVRQGVHAVKGIHR